MKKIIIIHAPATAPYSSIGVDIAARKTYGYWQENVHEVGGRKYPCFDVWDSTE